MQIEPDTKIVQTRFGSQTSLKSSHVMKSTRSALLIQRSYSASMASRESSKGISPPGMLTAEALNHLTNKGLMPGR
jgi:hypothetical protein